MKNNSQEKSLILGYIMKDKSQNTPNDFINHQYHSNIQYSLTNIINILLYYFITLVCLIADSI